MRTKLASLYARLHIMVSHSLFCFQLTTKRKQELRHRTLLRSFLLALTLLMLLTLTVMVVAVLSRTEPPKETLTVNLSTLPKTKPNETPLFHLQTHQEMELQNHLSLDGPYHNWELFATDYQEMLQNLKIFVYPDINSTPSPFTSIFHPHPKPFDPKLGNYFSEHAFKLALLNSPLLTPNPQEANFFFMPFSINAMRNHPLIRSSASISNFVADYTNKIISNFEFWNASSGSDHFFVCCHSIGREATSKHQHLHNNAIQITCSSSYFQRLYITHKDLAFPQIWPRQKDQNSTPPPLRNKLVFYSGRTQNSGIRQEIMELFGNDTSMDIYAGNMPYPYEEGFRRSRFCLHVKGYEVNTARVSDAIHYGCVPVVLSNYYDLPFANVLDWNKFSIIINHGDIKFLKRILMSVSKDEYMEMYKNLGIVRKHFVWHIKTPPTNYDSFYMTAYQLWLRRGLHRLSS